MMRKTCLAVTVINHKSGLKNTDDIHTFLVLLFPVPLPSASHSSIPGRVTHNFICKNMNYQKHCIYFVALVVF